MKAVFNRDERTRRRSARRSRAMAVRASGGSPMPALPSRNSTATADPNIELIRRAQIDRDEIMRILAQMKPADRAMVPDVGRSASLLADRVQTLAISLADIDRGTSQGAVASLESEISRLEGTQIRWIWRGAKHG